MRPLSYRYRASNIRVIDGDTIEAVVDLGFYTFQRLRFRFARLNAYELNSEIELERDLAMKAKAMVSNLVEGQVVTIESQKTEKYGRWLAEVFIGSDNLNDKLIASGLVKKV